MDIIEPSEDSIGTTETPFPEITAHLQTAPSFNNVLKSSICANTSSKDSLSVVELPDFSFESTGSVSAKYPGRLGWTRKAGDISLMKLVDEPAPFVPSNEALLRSVCIEDMGFTGKTLLNELPLNGSLSKDDLSFSQLQKDESFRIPECDSSMLMDVSQLPSSSRDNSILYGKRPVPAQYPGRLGWTRKEGDLSITKLTDEVAPFVVTTTEASLQSMCIEDTGFTVKTLLDEPLLKGSPSLDDLSFSQLRKETARSSSSRIPMVVKHRR